MTHDELDTRLLQFQEIGRVRNAYLRCRVSNWLSILGVIAGAVGYRTQLKKTTRKKIYSQAGEMARAVAKGGKSGIPHLDQQILVVMDAVTRFAAGEKLYSDELKRMLNDLPIMTWLKSPDQKGLGKLGLARALAEIGNPSWYPNPAKIWRRMGLAPWTYQNQTKMGRTWRIEGGLNKKQWSAFGYSPRRRSVAFDNASKIMMANRDGLYGQRYDVMRARFVAAHPDSKDQRYHFHGLLCISKELYKNLWITWRDLHGLWPRPALQNILPDEAEMPDTEEDEDIDEVEYEEEESEDVECSLSN